MDKISVIIPTYRPQSYLWECLDSLRAQTLSSQKFEVLIILNGEKEPYFSMIQNYIKQNNCSNFNLFYSTDKGVSNARNIGLDMAMGTYITFIDDDDYVSNSFLESLLKHSTPETISLSNFIAFFDQTHEIIPHSLNKCFVENSKKTDIKYQTVRKYFSAPYAKAIHKDIINNKRFDPKFRIGEDSLFLFAISDSYKYISFTDSNAIYFRRFRAESVSIGSKGSLIVRIKNAWQLCFQYINIYSQNPKSYNLNFLITRILGACRSAFNRSNPAYIKFQKNKSK